MKKRASSTHWTVWYLLGGGTSWLVATRRPTREGAVKSAKGIRRYRCLVTPPGVEPDAYTPTPGGLRIVEVDQ